jgi:hypothetical protein
MIRRGLPLILATLCIAALASPVAAAPGVTPTGPDAADADHIGGSFQVCGRVLEFTAPTVSSDGTLEVVGGGHVFVLDPSASVDARVASLAAAGEWTCFHLTAVGGVTIVDVVVADDTSCGPLLLDGGTFVLQGSAVPGSSDRFTTVTLDGDAGAIVGADSDLGSLLEAIATVDGAGQTCLQFELAGDGTLASIVVDYAASPASEQTAPIACGLVDGDPVEFRDVASNPTPWDLTNIILVDGFGIDAGLFDLPTVSVLLASLDAGKEVCLLARVDDTVIVEVAVLTGPDPDVCGTLQVQGHQVYVDRVWVPTPLTALWATDVTNAVLGDACLSVRSQEGAVHASVVMCETLTAWDDVPRPPGDALQASFTASGVTFALTAPIDADPGLVLGTRSGFVLDGPDPYEAFGSLNPALLGPTALDGCRTGALPDTAVWGDVASPAAALAVGLMLLLAALALGSAAVWTSARART